jgi:hypothetical protein
MGSNVTAETRQVPAVCHLFERKQRVNCTTKFQVQSSSYMVLLEKPRLSGFDLILRSHQFHLDLLSTLNTRFPSPANSFTTNSSLSFAFNPFTLTPQRLESKHRHEKVTKLVECNKTRVQVRKFVQGIILITLSAVTAVVGKFGFTQHEEIERSTVPMLY